MLTNETPSPIEITGFISNGKNIRTKIHLVFPVEYIYQDHEHWYRVNLSHIGQSLSILEYTLETLKISILEELEFLWDNYACVQDDGMTCDAIQLKQRLLNIFEEY